MRRCPPRACPMSCSATHNPSLTSVSAAFQLGGWHAAEQQFTGPSASASAQMCRTSTQQALLPTISENLGGVAVGCDHTARGAMVQRDPDSKLSCAIVLAAFYARRHISLKALWPVDPSGLWAGTSRTASTASRCSSTTSEPFHPRFLFQPGTSVLLCR